LFYFDAHWGGVSRSSRAIPCHLSMFISLCLDGKMGLNQAGTGSALRQVRNALMRRVKRASNVSNDATANAPT
jgi:hypothetical protein